MRTQISLAEKLVTYSAVTKYLVKLSTAVLWKADQMLIEAVGVGEVVGKKLKMLV